MTLAWNPELLEHRHKSCGEFERRCPCCQRPIVRRGVSEDLAISLAVKLFGVTRDDLLSNRRHANLVDARAFVVWALRSLGRAKSYPVIGRALGRDPSSAVHLHRKSIELRLSNDDFDAACRGLGLRWLETGEPHHARCP